MDNKELIKNLNQFPANAIIYTESDHGQCSEQSGSITVCTDKPESTGVDSAETLQDYPYYGEDLNWRDTNEVDPKDVTAIRIR